MKNKLTTNAANPVPHALASVSGSEAFMQWLEKERSNAYWRAKVKSKEGDESSAQWWRGNGAMCQRILTTMTEK